MKKTFFQLSLCLSLLHPYLYANNRNLGHLPAPYGDLTTLMAPCHTPNWFTTAQPLSAELQAQPGNNLVVIEVGSFLGTSTIFIANLPRVDTVYAIDHWKGSPGFETSVEVSHMLPTLYEQFLSNVVHAKATHIIKPVKLDSLTAAKSLSDVQADLIYIDGDHDETPVYADLNAWAPKLKLTGVLCGDDWAYTGVRAAVKRYATEQGLKVKVVNNFWKLYR